MEAKCSSETWADFQQNTRRYIPEDRTLQWLIFISYEAKLKGTGFG
jgi:hypothetical protein